MTSKVRICKKCGEKVCGPRCIPCRKKYLKAQCADWYLRNKEKVNAANKRYAVLHPECIKKSRRRCKESISRRTMAWRKKNPHRCAAIGAKHRAAKKQAMPAWANTFFIDETYDLARLRTKMLGTPWEVDHIVPLQNPLVCGLHVPHNLQVVPRSVNRQKSNVIWPDMPN